MRGRPGGLTLELFPKPAVALSPGGQRQRELALVATAADAGCLVWRDVKPEPFSLQDGPALTPLGRKAPGTW